MLPLAQPLRKEKEKEMNSSPYSLCCLCFIFLLISYQLQQNQVVGNIVKTRSFGPQENEALVNLSLKVLKSDTSSYTLKDSYYAIKLLKESKTNTEQENKKLITSICESAGKNLKSNSGNMIHLSDIAYSTLIVSEFKECKESNTNNNPLDDSTIKSNIKSQILSKMDSGPFTERDYAILTATILYNIGGETEDELKKKIESSVKRLVKFLNVNDGTVKEKSSMANETSNTLNSYKLLDILNRVSTIMETTKTMKKAADKMLQLLPLKDSAEDVSGEITDPMVYPLLLSLSSSESGTGNSNNNGYSSHNLEDIARVTEIASLLVDLLDTNNIENAYKISNALLTLPGKKIPVVTCITPTITIEESSLQFTVTDLYGDAFTEDGKIEVKAENLIRAPKATDDVLGETKVLNKDSKAKSTFALNLLEINDFSAGVYIIKLLINGKYSARKLLQVMETNTSLDDLC